MNEYEILKFACLFHDIGKFYQRSDGMGYNKSVAYDSKYSKLNIHNYGENGDHSKWSADFVSNYFEDLVEDLVLYHHKPENSVCIELCEMLQKADNHSSNEIQSGDRNLVLNTPLTSIFSRISLDGNDHEDYYVPLVPLDFTNEDLYPRKINEKKDSNLISEYKLLWSQFKSEFHNLKNKNFESSLALIRKYTSTMPLEAYKDANDISLYDHLKTTVAIANCRYLYSKEKNLNQKDTQRVYKVINGDISGIQKFIYKVRSPEEAQNGMSKRLRGRSVYLTLLTEAIASKFVKDLNLDSTNILFCGGGRFTILAPNILKTDEVVKNINCVVNKEFINKFNAELFLNIASIEVCGNDLGNFDEILSKLYDIMNENKKYKFINQLSDIFKMESEVDYKLCPVCGNKAENDKFCKECIKHEKLGFKVTNAKYLIKYISDKELQPSIFYSKLNFGYSFHSNKKDVLDFIKNNTATEFKIYKLNDTNFLDFDIDEDNISFDFMVIGNSVPNIDDNVLYFNHLAEISKGANKLGILKMDVDNLGLIFSQGFKHLNNNGNGVSISRVSSLSFYLDLFFSGCINQIIQKFNFSTSPISDSEPSIINFVDNEYNIIDQKTIYKEENELFGCEKKSTIHINYSGGDDLLVVGPYDDIIKFSYEFRKKFKKWTTYNNSINISAGILLISPKFPIGKAALMVDKELEKSKNCGRNKITIFGDVLSWDSNGKLIGFNELLKFGEYLEELNKKYISKGFIYSLLQIWKFKSNIEPLNRFNEEFWISKNSEKLKKKCFIPLFKYKLRDINKDVRDDLDKKGLKYMPWIKTPVSWAILRLRLR